MTTCLEEGGPDDTRSADSANSKLHFAVLVRACSASVPIQPGCGLFWSVAMSIKTPVQVQRLARSQVHPQLVWLQARLAWHLPWGTLPPMDLGMWHLEVGRMRLWVSCWRHV
jgi:hypothetical protein